MTTPETITIRTALPADVRSLRRLGELDSRPHLVGALLARGGLPADFLIAEVDGEPWAAIVIQTGELLANPWRATGLAPSKPPPPGSVPKLPQTIFNLEKRGGTNNGNVRPFGRK